MIGKDLGCRVTVKDLGCRMTEKPSQAHIKNHVCRMTDMVF
jgi:hypothetical protein